MHVSFFAWPILVLVIRCIHCQFVCVANIAFSNTVYTLSVCLRGQYCLLVIRCIYFQFVCVANIVFINTVYTLSVCLRGKFCFYEYGVYIVSLLAWPILLLVIRCIHCQFVCVANIAFMNTVYAFVSFHSRAKVNDYEQIL